MPELPELEVVCEVLEKRVVGQRITDVTLLPPGAAIVVRDLTGAGFVQALVGRTFASVHRRGKFLVLAFDQVSPRFAWFSIRSYRAACSWPLLATSAAPKRM